jgi:RHS repeat-associated protein
MKNRTSSKDATASDVTVSSPSLGRRLTALLVAFTLTVQTLPAFAGVYYIHTDHLDTPRAVTNAQNQIIWQSTPLTEPFGSSAPEEDPDGDGQTFTLNLRFPGQYFDQETNAHYNYYRDHYVPSLGRYGQSDPIGLYGGINTYSYVNGNPLIYVDPEGKDPVTAGAACVVVIGVTAYIFCVLSVLNNCKKKYPGHGDLTSSDRGPFMECIALAPKVCSLGMWMSDPLSSALIESAAQVNNANWGNTPDKKRQQDNAEEIERLRQSGVFD